MEVQNGSLDDQFPLQIPQCSGRKSLKDLKDGLSEASSWFHFEN